MHRFVRKPCETLSSKQRWRSTLQCVALISLRDAQAYVRPQTTIRIRFTDRTQLEKTFPSTDKIRSVYAFVRNLLREDVKPIKFVLCESLQVKLCHPATQARRRPDTSEARTQGV